MQSRLKSALHSVWKHVPLRGIQTSAAKDMLNWEAAKCFPQELLSVVGENRFERKNINNLKELLQETWHTQPSGDSKDWLLLYMNISSKLKAYQDTCRAFEIIRQLPKSEILPSNIPSIAMVALVEAQQYETALDYFYERRQEYNNARHLSRTEYMLAIRAASWLDDLEQVEGLFTEAAGFDISPRADAIADAMLCFANAGHKDQVLDLFQLIKGPQPNKEVIPYNGILHIFEALDVIGEQDIAWEFFKSLPLRNQIYSKVFSAMLQLCSQNRQQERVKELLESVNDPSKWGPRMLQEAMEAYRVVLARPSDAFRLYENLRDDRNLMTSNVIHEAAISISHPRHPFDLGKLKAFMQHLLDRNLLKEGYPLINGYYFKRPDKRSYDAIVLIYDMMTKNTDFNFVNPKLLGHVAVALAHTGQVERASELKDILSKKRRTSDSAKRIQETFEMQFDEALAFKELTFEKVCDRMQQGVELNVRDYTRAIQTFKHKPGNFEILKSLHEHATANGIKFRHPQLYQSLLSIYATEADIDGAIKVFSECESAGLRPPFQMYTRLIQLCFDTNRSAEKAVELFDQLKQIETPHTHVYNNMMQIMLTRGAYKSALEYFSDLQESSSSPDMYSFLNALRAVTALKDSEYGDQLFALAKESKVSLDKIFTQYLLLYTRCGRPQEAERLMKENDFPFNFRVSMSICAAYAKLQNLSKVEDCLASLDETQPSFGLRKLYETIIQIFSTTQPDVALELAHRFTRRSFPDVKDYQAEKMCRNIWKIAVVSFTDAKQKEHVLKAQEEFRKYPLLKSNTGTTEEPVELIQ